MSFQKGDRITHREYGAGIVLESPCDGYIQAFFINGGGERRVPCETLQKDIPRNERILRAVQGGTERARRARLSYEAYALPIMDDASALTSAKIDLLPHQIVLTHRVATASPRRFLIGDEVGLGKTIETALIVRELASRGELNRALIIVPAGLVHNWHRELNEVFALNFEVFGAEGDITDRKTNAFAKHDRLIASIDTLKTAARMKRLLNAPLWDLVIFDEAHHINAERNGKNIRKTQKYKLAELIKDRTRDLILLSATPHKGKHFPFWMLVQLLNPTLFNTPEDMLEHRHRLNAIMFRRTKADACAPDGSPLFARRMVQTESFVMGEAEKRFYEHLRAYLQEGFNLAKRQGNRGRALGFLMAIFQKIAASSFAAVGGTLKRRLLMLVVHEAHLCDRDLDIEGRERLLEEARTLIHEQYAISHDVMGRSEVERILADLKYRLLKKLDEEALEQASDSEADEMFALGAEESAADSVQCHLPEERLRIREVLDAFPQYRETKVQKLLDALEKIWHDNPDEKIVIFVTYLGTVDLVAREIEQAFPQQGVVVLRGGDHGAKIAAERKFRQKNGPRVLVCTAAGREGINLQFARILFNFDLPWNPMDLEQRIGRIHRYGQNHTAQVYNLVLSDTIEGRIFLLLDEKLKEIARTVGKVDEGGNVAEDLRAQILGQLSERLDYNELYQTALSDPELKRTRQELETALSNAKEAREVVFDLFQDLEGFSLDEYKPFSDVSTSLEKVAQFLSEALAGQNKRFEKIDSETYELIHSDQPNQSRKRFTLKRENATNNEQLDLLGLDHPLVQQELEHWRNCPEEDIGIAVLAEVEAPIILSIWRVEVSAQQGERRVMIQPIAMKQDGTRVPFVEQNYETYFNAPPTTPPLTLSQRLEFLTNTIEPALQRELKHKGILSSDKADKKDYSLKLIGYIEINPTHTRVP